MLSPDHIRSLELLVDHMLRSVERGQRVGILASGAILHALSAAMI
jgi:hypothetical protein